MIKNGWREGWMAGQLNAKAIKADREADRQNYGDREIG
jgi:hypothetical protein